MAWRFAVCLPFVLIVAWLVNRRPALLPYLMVMPGLLDAQLVWLIPH